MQIHFNCCKKFNNYGCFTLDVSSKWRYRKMDSGKTPLKTDLNSVEFSDWTGNPLFVCENVAAILNAMSLVTNILLSRIKSVRKILLTTPSNFPNGLEFCCLREKMSL